MRSTLFRSSLAAFAMMAGSGLLQAAEGDLPFELRNRLRVEYDDNIREEETDKDSSFKIIEELDLGITLKSDNTFLTLNYIPSFIYWEDRAEDETDFQHQLDASLRHAFSRSSRAFSRWTSVSGDGRGPRFCDSDDTAPSRAARRHCVMCDEYSPSRRRIRPCSPGPASSNSFKSLSLYSAVYRRRVAFAGTSGSGTPGPQRWPRLVFVHRVSLTQPDEGCSGVGCLHRSALLRPAQ